MRDLKRAYKNVKENYEYTASFTAAALLFAEYLKIEEFLYSENFEELIDQEVKRNEFLSIKTEAARKRVTQEIRKRYEYTSKEFWEMFFTLQEEEQKLALFYLCLKTYPLVMDFHVEVALKKWQSRSLKLDTIDLQMRLDEIASVNEEVSGWSEATQRKTMTVYIRMLNEAGLLKDDELIQPKNINTDFWDYFLKLGEGWFIEACFHNQKQI